LDGEGGFYAALDADSEGVEGKFYVWSKREINIILGNDSELFCSFFDVAEKGNWEEKNILRILKNVEIFAAENSISESELTITLDKCLQKLLAERNKRIRPATDDKILLGWNALMVTALCKAAAALNDEGYKKLAENTIGFILQKFRRNNLVYEFFHTYKNEAAKYPAFLDDYAYLVQSLIQLQEVTSNTDYLDLANDITSFVIDNFLDEETGYFFFTNKDQSDIILRKKEVYDGATPSGNSIMAENLFYLSVVFDSPELYNIAEKIITSLGSAVVRYPTSFGIWASLIIKNTFGVNELAILGNDFVLLRNQLLQEYIPGRILQAADNNENERFPMLRGKNSVGETLIYLCRQYGCKSPVCSLNELLVQIKEEIKIKE
jgi:hypothetical protein